MRKGCGIGWKVAFGNGVMGSWPISIAENLAENLAENGGGENLAERN